MKPQIITHSWNLSEEEALKLQHELATKVIKEDYLGEIKNIAGVDVAYDKSSDKSNYSGC